jgi:hypothetical protein
MGRSEACILAEEARKNKRRRSSATVSLFLARTGIAGGGRRVIDSGRRPQ